MDRQLRGAIEAVLQESLGCSEDVHGYVQGMPMLLLADLWVQYNKYRKKHGQGPIRGRRKETHG